MSAEAPQTPEIPADPFEGLDQFSSNRELAMAEIWQQVVETDPSDTERIDSLSKDLDLANNMYHESAIRGNRAVLYGIDMVSKYAKSARWRPEGIDPEQLDEMARNYMEGAWLEASRAKVAAEIAQLRSEIALMEAEYHIARAKGLEPKLDMDRRAELFDRIDKLTPPRTTGGL